MRRTNVRPRHVRWSIGAALLVFITVCRFSQTTGEWYARHVYPVVSGTLSGVASVVPFSLEEVLAVAAAGWFPVYPWVARRRGQTMRHIALRLAEVAAWLYVWFYVGWGMNYFRETFYVRAGVQPAAYADADFRAFLRSYTDSLNAAYLRIDSIDRGAVRQAVQASYDRVPPDYGLLPPDAARAPKRVLFSGLYSGVGVLGYMGPFFAEMQLNADLPPAQYPFTYAHELAHVLGVSSEAEANFWAYHACIGSDRPEVRYCGYFGLLPYVIVNARAVLPADDYRAWTDSLRREVILDLNEKQTYWEERYYPPLGRLQDAVYDLFLQGNRIASGRKNYAEVIQMLMSIECSPMGR